MALVKVLEKPSVTKNVWVLLHFDGHGCPSSLNPMQILMHYLFLNISGISNFKNLTSVTVSNVKPLDVRYMLNLTAFTECHKHHVFN